MTLHGQLPETRTCVRALPGKLEASEEPLLALAPGEVCVAIEGVEVGDMEWRALREGQGIIPGGAAIGKVVAGEGTAESWVEVSVLIPPLLPCEECHICRRGWVTACAKARRLGVTTPGTFASHIVLPPQFLCRLSGELALEAVVERPALALLAGSAARVHDAFSRAGLGPNELAILLGDGPLLPFAMNLARARGAHAVAAREASEVARAVEQLEPALPYRVFVLQGDAELLARGVALASPGGSISLLHPIGQPTLPIEEFAARELTLRASQFYHPDLLPEIAALYLKGELTAHETARIVSLKDLPAVLAREADPTPLVFVP